MTTNTISRIAAFNRDMIPKENSERRELGRQHTSAAMIFWLARNQWSHPNLEDLAAWALNEEGAIHTSQISHIRNGKMRMMGVKTLDAFGAINLAVWAYHHDREALKTLGVATITDKIQGLIEFAEPIMNPNTDEPLDAGGWMNLYLGYLRIPGVVGGAKGDIDFEKAVNGLGRYVSRVISQSGKDFIEARPVLERSMGPDDAQKLIAVAAGLGTYSSTELAATMAKICEALERLDGQRRTPEGMVADLIGAAQ